MHEDDYEENEDLIFQDQQDSEFSIDPLGKEQQDHQQFEDDSIQGFFGHQSSVYCLDVAGDLAISGDGNDKAFVWSISQGETLWTLPDRACSDSIVASRFSWDGKLAAFASLDGKIFLLDCCSKTPEIAFCTLEDGPSEISALCWHPKGNVLAVGSEDGSIWMWNILGISTSGSSNDGHQRLLGVFAGVHTQAINDLTFSVDGKILLSVSEDGVCCCWNPKSCEALAKYSWTANSRFIEGPLNCICPLGASNAKVAIVSGRNGLCRLIDVTANRILGAFDGHEASVESLLVNERLSILVSASIDGRINFWDLEKGTLRTSALVLPQEAGEDAEPIGITRMKWKGKEQIEFVTACTDGVLRIWDCRSGELQRELTGHQDVVLDLAVSEDGKIVSCSDDCTCLVFE